MFKEFWLTFKKTFKEEYDKIRLEDEKKYAEKIHLMRFMTDTKYREDFQLQQAKLLCKMFEKD